MPKRPLPPPGEPGEVYLIHLNRKIAHAQHYTGWRRRPDGRRDREHQSGNGARLLAVANERGISYRVVRAWPGADRRFERRLKNLAIAPKLCPVCNPEGWDRRIPEAGEGRRNRKHEHEQEGLS